MKTYLSRILVVAALLVLPLFLAVCKQGGQEAACESQRADFMEYFQAHRHEYVQTKDAPAVITFRMDADPQDIFREMHEAGKQADMYILVAQAENEEIILPITICMDREEIAQSDWSTDGKQGCVAPPGAVVRYTSLWPLPGMSPLYLKQDGSVEFFGKGTRVLEPPHREDGKAASRYNSAALDAYLDQCAKEAKIIVPVTIDKGVDLRDIVAFHQIFMRHPELEIFLYVPPAQDGAEAEGLKIEN